MISLTEFLVLHSLFCLDLSLPRCSACSCNQLISLSLYDPHQGPSFIAESVPLKEMSLWGKRKFCTTTRLGKSAFPDSLRDPLKFLPCTPKLCTDFPAYSHHNFKFCHPHHPWNDRILIFLNCWKTLNWFHSYLILNSHLSYLLFHLDFYQVTAWTSPTLFILMLLFAMSISQIKQQIQLR